MIDALLRELLDEGVAAGAFPAASAWVSADGRRVGVAHVGAAHARTRWDLASLTKPMAVVDRCMRGVSDGSIDLDMPIAADLPAQVTVRAILGHRSGMPAWKDLVAALPPGFTPGSRTTRIALEALVRQAARDADPSRGVEYSDLGFMLLGRWLERRSGRRLRSLVPGYRRESPPSDKLPLFVSCGYCPWRRREVIGEVHDPNAWAWGGAAGHAGLFATVRRVGRWATDLAEGRAEGIDPGVARAFWDAGARASHPPGATWVLGWDTPSPEGSSAGATASPESVGHLGFTGTSVWLDRGHRLVMVLLTNRVALGPDAQPRLRAFRPRFHDAIRERLAR